MTKTAYIITAVLIAVAVVVGILIRERNQGNEYQNDQQSSSPQRTDVQQQDVGTGVLNSTTTATSTNAMNKESGAAISAPTNVSANVTVITYNGSAFVPSAVTIKKGETVEWKNVSSTKMWPASAVHPTHDEYPAKGGCLGSTFDACNGIEPGGSWSFTFDFVGDWRFHNHLSPRVTGIVHVTQ